MTQFELEDYQAQIVNISYSVQWYGSAVCVYDDSSFVEGMRFVIFESSSSILDSSALVIVWVIYHKNEVGSMYIFFPSFSPGGVTSCLRLFEFLLLFLLRASEAI